MAQYVRSVLFLILVMISTVSYAASSPAIKTDQGSLKFVTSGYDSNGNITAGLYFDLKRGWKVYWREAGDTGFPPRLDWNKSQNIKSAEILWPIPQRLREQLTEEISSESYGYGDEILFPIIITPQDANKPVQMNVHVNYAICKEICIPAEADLSLDVPLAYHSAKEYELINKHLGRVPHDNGYAGINISNVALGVKDSGEQYLQVTVDSEKISLKKADIFIEGGGDFAFYNPTATISKDGLMAVFNAPITTLTDAKDITGNNFNITIANGNNSVELQVAGDDIGQVVSALPMVDLPIAEEEAYTLGVILLFALLGGFILNVMPCVLPVLSIKLMGVIKYGGGNKGQVAFSFIITALGIIFSFIALGALVVFLRSIGMNVGWGFHFQEPLFIISLVVILTLFAANMWGFYEFRLPALGGSTYDKCKECNPIGYFLTGVFATILATPCTAPFLGVAVGFALSRDTADIILTFAAMGVGMALPYLFFSIFPKAVTKLPKPGKWMATVKHTMGLLLAITAVWLIWVLSSQLGKTAALVLAIICTIKLIKLWAAKYIDFLAKLPVRIVIIGLAIIMAFILPVKMADKANDQQYQTTDIWEEFRRDDIDLLVKHGQVVFVDVTADWCLTCKMNKFLVLDSKLIKSYFEQELVIAMKADWTNKSDYIADYLKSHNRVGIPFNIVYGPGAPDGIILSELLKKEDVIKAIKKAKKQK